MFFTLHLISWSYANLRQMSKSKRLVEQILNWRLRFIRQAVAGTQEGAAPRGFTAHFAGSVNSGLGFHFV